MAKKSSDEMAAEFEAKFGEDMLQRICEFAYDPETFRGQGMFICEHNQRNMLNHEWVIRIALGDDHRDEDNSVWVYIEQGDSVGFAMHDWGMDPVSMGEIRHSRKCLVPQTDTGWRYCLNRRKEARILEHDMNYDFYMSPTNSIYKYYRDKAHEVGCTIETDDGYTAEIDMPTIYKFFVSAVQMKKVMKTFTSGEVRIINYDGPGWTLVAQDGDSQYIFNQNKYGTWPRFTFKHYGKDKVYYWLFGDRKAFEEYAMLTLLGAEPCPA